MAFSKGFARTRSDILIRGYGWVRDAIPVDYYVGTTEPGSSGSDLFHGTQEDSYLVGVASAGRPGRCDDPTYYGSFRDFYPSIRRYIDPTGTEDPIRVVDRIPYFPRDRLPTQQGFVRLFNLSNREATVLVKASDDTSSSFVHACTMRIPALAALNFNSRDIEVGNTARGCTGVGRGE